MKLISYTKAPIPPLAINKNDQLIPASFNLYLQNEDQKIVNCTDSLINAVIELQGQVKTLQAQVAALQAQQKSSSGGSSS